MEAPLIKKKVGGIYCIRNTINNLVYIGSSNSIRDRFYYHSERLRKQTHDNEYLQNSYNKYGRENFEFIVLELVEEIDNLTVKEQYYIDFYNSAKRNCGFNLVENAIRGTLPQESRNKLSLKLKGRKHTPEALAKLRKNIARGEKHYRYGIVPSKEERERQSKKISGVNNVHFGKTFGPEVRKRMSDAKKGKSQKSNCRRPVIQLSLDGEILNRYETIKEAGEIYGCRVTIGRACRNSKIAYNFLWMYASTKMPKL